MSTVTTEHKMAVMEAIRALTDSDPKYAEEHRRWTAGPSSIPGGEYLVDHLLKWLDAHSGPQSAENTRSLGHAAPADVGRDKVTIRDQAAETLHGTPYGEHLQPLPSGQQTDYVVLSPAERAKGFVEPVRQVYVHTRCGTETRMGLALAETYARDPEFYSGTFCAFCRNHYPVGADGEFLWQGTAQKVGTRHVRTMLEPIA
jgi:hypothetical protein